MCQIAEARPNWSECEIGEKRVNFTDKVITGSVFARKEEVW